MSAWKDENYIRAYELARSGLSDAKISSALGVSALTFGNWKRAKSALKDALERARLAKDGKQQTFAEFVYRQLPQNLQELWDQISRCSTVKNGIQRIEALLDNAGKQARQHLFLYALVNSSFSPSEACRQVNISRSTLESWVTQEPEFSMLMDEIHWHKQNFFEASLVDRVKEGDPSCTIFANKTYNRDRGYGEKLDVDLKGNINHTHTHLHVVVKVDDLQLPIETRKLILQAVRAKKTAPVPTTNQLPSPSILNGEVLSHEQENQATTTG